MTTMVPIQDNWPIPKVDRRGNASRRKWPLHELQVGQMFFAPGKQTKYFSAYVARETKDLPGKFETRHCWARPVGMRGGQRVWEPCKEHDDGAHEGTGVWRTE